MTFDTLGLETAILEAVKKKGYTEATPIQEQAIPAVLKGHDILGGAQTGTGKTAAFMLPILQILNGQKHIGNNPRALVLVPTRELALQVTESAETYGTHLDLKSTCVYGGVGINPQITAFKNGVDIVIATPGRLMDHINQKTVNLNEISILVLDEADRMLDMGFRRDIQSIIDLLPSRRQNLLFSATYLKGVRELANSLLKNPKAIEVSKRNTAAETVKQVVHFVEKGRKVELLSHLIKDGNWFQALIFTRTKESADILAKQLEKEGIPSGSIHGDKTQAARNRVLEKFKTGDLQALVATDVAARGIDLTNLEHVVNYELPQIAEDYIHRIGRTGRAGSKGCAISLISQDDTKKLGVIERLLKTDIQVQEVEGFSIKVKTDAPVQKKANSRQDKSQYRSPIRNTWQKQKRRNKTKKRR